MATNLAMPLLIFNMGGEMMYILQQRLQAQGIPADKSERVLNDIISTMFAPKFVDELFRPEQMYAYAITRQIFDRLSHSSIMRLNSTSMDKLFDLMTMGVKYQILCSAHPYDMLQASLNHFDAMRDMVKTNASAVKLVDSAMDRLIQTFAVYDAGQLGEIRNALLRFFQDRRVKVSVFLQDGLQLQSGAIIVSSRGPAPLGSEPPGLIRYYDENGKVDNVVTIPNMPNANGVQARRPLQSVLTPERPCQLGKNVYLKERSKSATTLNDAPSSSSTSSSTFPSTSLRQNAQSPITSSRSLRGDLSSRSPRNPEDLDGRAAKAELNALAALVGNSHAESLKEEDESKIGAALLAAVSSDVSHQNAGNFIMANLFSLDDGEEEGGYDPSRDVLTFEPVRSNHHTHMMTDDLDNLLIASTSKPKNNRSGGKSTTSTNDDADDDDDLLALMDQASAQ